MADKTLRILIADTRHFHRMKIERMFNALDYYRIGPVQDLIELLTLVDYGCQPFDVLMVNAELAKGMPDLCGYLFDHPQVRHVLVYGESLSPSDFSGYLQPGITACQATLPSMSAISRLMAWVEAFRKPSLHVCPATSLAPLHA